MKKTSEPALGAASAFATTYFHGTKADLELGDLIVPGKPTNYGQNQKASYVFLTATLNAAIWGAALAKGDGKERIYVVEPLGELEDDPDLTNQKFPGNPTKSYRSTSPLRIVGELCRWQTHEAEKVAMMKAHLAKLAEQGIQSLND